MSFFQFHDLDRAELLFFHRHGGSHFSVEDPG